MEQKTFHSVLRRFSAQPQLAKKTLADKRLTQIEKDILRGYLLLRSNKNAEVIALMESYQGSYAGFVEAHKLLLLGLAHNNLTHHHRGKKLLQAAYAKFQEFGQAYYEYVCLANLFIVSSNQHNLRQMKKYLDQIQKISFEDQAQQARSLHLVFMYHVASSNFVAAEKVLRKIRTFFDVMFESDKVSYLLQEFMYYVKIEKFDQARNVLQEMKQFRKFHTSVNYNFNRILLAHIGQNAPIYFADQDFQDSKVLFHQMKVIQLLECYPDDHHFAYEHWQKLMQEDSSLYKKNFEYKGGKGLFSLCLEKHLSKKKIDRRNKAIQEAGEEKQKLKKLLVLFQTTKEPISKEQIYLLLWGKSPQDKKEYARLFRLIYKIKKNYQLDIKSRKGTYYVKLAG